MKDVAAQVITPRFRSLAEGEVMEKNPGDLVTVADREAEELITAALAADTPDALVVGEEATEFDPALLTRLAASPHAFVVDPIDGTKNFVHGRADHAVMIAELRDGASVRAWIWQPEHGVSWVAEAGAGVERNGVAFTRPAPSSDPAEMRGGTSRRGLRQQMRPTLPRVTETVWCCGVDYPMLAAGDLDFLVYGPPKPWDHAPGTLIVTELGGTCRLLDGQDFRERGVLVGVERCWRGHCVAL